MSRFLDLQHDAGKVGLVVFTYNAGNPSTSYRFFRSDDANARGYFAGDGIFTAYGLKAAETFLAGFNHGYHIGTSQPTRVYVEVKGGMVQDVKANRQHVTAVIRDFDTDGVMFQDEDNIHEDADSGDEWVETEIEAVKVAN